MPVEKTKPAQIKKNTQKKPVRDDEIKKYNAYNERMLKIMFEKKKKE